MVQRPDLVGAVVCQVPVADMLRYHLFTVGRYWIPEYGSAEDPAQFPFLYRYSPYHNVKDGTAYPATLVTTADTDDRVAPGLAKKFAARLQEATAGDKPILIRVETKAGHGAGKPISKQIDEQADIYTFLFWQLGAGGAAEMKATRIRLSSVCGLHHDDARSLGETILHRGLEALRPGLSKHSPWVSIEPGIMTWLSMSTNPTNV